MWLRSQNKEILVDSKKIYIECDFLDYDCNHKTYFIKGDCILGQYSTKEKAIKVMDMIQNAITGTRFEFIDIVRDCDLAGIEIHNVFNMPKDEEVE